MNVYSLLIAAPEARQEASVSKILQKYYPEAVLRFCGERGIVVRALAAGERYDLASPALRRLNANVDDWPVPPAGLFVVEERTVYLRSLSPMTVVHEFGHALDCALGNGVYFSSIDSGVRAAFQSAKEFVSCYAASAADEFFAENARALCGANDRHSFWPNVTPTRLRAKDPVMFALMSEIFADPYRFA